MTNVTGGRKRIHSSFRAIRDLCTNADNGQLIVNLNYRVRETNNEFNLVFPFFLKEGTRT